MTGRRRKLRGFNVEPCNRAGFTLVEILGVVVVLSIISAIVVPQLAARSDLQNASAGRAVMADLLYAQSRAIATQQMQYVTFDVTNQQYQLCSSMSPLTPLTQPITGNTYVMTFNGTSNSVGAVALHSVNFGGQPTVAFDEFGAPYSYNSVSNTTTALSAAGTVVMTCGNYSLTLSVSQDTGEITVQ